MIQILHDADMDQPAILTAWDARGQWDAVTAETRRDYEMALSTLAAAWGQADAAVRDGVAALCERERRATAATGDARAGEERRLRSEPGYYLLDPAGVAALRTRLSIAPGRAETPAYTARLVWTIAATSAASLVVASLLMLLFPAPPNAFAAALALGIIFFLVAVQPCWELMVMAAHALLPSRGASLPRLDLATGVTPEHATVVTIPVLLVDRQQVQELCGRLRDLDATLRDPDVSIAVLTDFADAPTPMADPAQLELLDTLLRAIDALNAETRSGRFVLLHRDPSFCATEQRWIGRERKRGKLEDLMTYVVTGESRFSRSAGPLRHLRRAQYLLVLDEHTRVTAGAVQALVGTASHPVNHPHVSPDGRRLTRGYGIFAPDIVEGRSWQRHPVAGEDDGGPRRDPLQDLFGESGYPGKGLVHIRAYHEVMRDLLPAERIISHDFAEASFLTTAAVLDVALIDDRREAPESLFGRHHRWIRGAWQNALFLPGNGRVRLMSPLGRWLLVKSLFASVFPIAATAALAAGAVIRPAALLIALPLMGAPVLGHVVGDVAHGIRRRQYADAWRGLRPLALVPLILLMAIAGAAHNALVALDAIGRTLGRVITGRHLLEWEPSVMSARARADSSTPSLCTRLWTLEAVGGLVLAAAAVRFTPYVALAVLLAIWSGSATLQLARASRFRRAAALAHPGVPS
jgi:cyclic beta-1,2-glucan synthetase